MPTHPQMPVLVAMLLPETYPHPVSTITVQDTHISRVFLTGRWAYKIKKAVDFGFLDFSTPARRLFFCRREVELNRRLTHGVYAEVVAVCRQKGGYRIDGAGSRSSMQFECASYQIGTPSAPDCRGGLSRHPRSSSW